MSFAKQTDGGSGAMRSSAWARFFAGWAISIISVVFGASAYARELAPVISGTPPASVVATHTYSFTPNSMDPNGERLTFYIKNKPSWAAFDSSTGRLSGTPAQSAVGTYANISIFVSNNRLWNGLPPFSVTVVGLIVRPPVISGTPPLSGTVGQQYVFRPQASDPNGARLTFSVKNKPAWAAFSTTTGALTGSPTPAGTYSNIVIGVTDGTANAALAGFSIKVNAATSSSPPPPSTGAGGKCGLQLGGTVTFCDTFDAPAGIGNRSGDLNGNVWGVSRDLWSVNFGQRQYDAAVPTKLVTCNGTTTVRPPKDVIICNGQLREATNDNPTGVFDNGGVTTLAMYPKQPFDFAGRTGTVSFDVSNDSHGTHSVWPEFWMSDLPVPAPFTHFSSWESLPQNGFGVRFAAQVGPGQWGLCPNGNNLGSSRWTVDSAAVVRNYVLEDADYQGVDYGTASTEPLTLHILDCVIAPADGSGVMNHIEVRVNQGEIDIYATDAGVAASPTTLKKIASVTNANLSFTRGLIWLEDVHYNADKETLMLGTAPSTSQSQHTFVWDNVAFDGPFTDRDFSYDALDANQPGPAYNAWNLGQFSAANETASWNVLNVPASPQATAVRVLFQFSGEENPVLPKVLNVIVNGHAHSTPWPYPDKLVGTWRTLAVTIPVTDLVAGTNVVQLGADQPLTTANVDIVLGGVPGGVPALPGNSTAYP
jgi:Putative Ig domain